MSECVKVMVRVRPMNQSEQDRKCKIIVDTDQKTNKIILKKLDQPDSNKDFSYDAIFPIVAAQQSIYESTAFNLVESVVQGYNGTIFAYGQTGCGKTFTMMGVPQSPELKGIIPRTFNHIMNIIESTKEKKFLVQCSFLQIYNEEIHDLLSKDIKEKKEIKESPDKGVYVKDLSRNTVKNVEEMDKYLNLGFKNRAVGATLMNSVSSRSHSIFTIFLESEQQGPVDILYLAGKLNLVDLAGSERQAKTQAEGDRLKEATKINLSLSALGNVISALVDSKSKHIPYRDSKLTRLLQDSLGGNTKTIMIANVSPADYNYDETLSTLRYASRAKFIQNKPTINEDPKDALLKEYAEEIKRLKEMLQNGGMMMMPQQNGGAAVPMIAAAQVNGFTNEVNNIEKENYQGLLKDKQEELQRHKLEKEAILEKLKSMEGQVVQGGTKQNTVQVKKYKDLKAKVKKHKQQQQKLIQQAAKAEQQLGNITQSFKTVQQQNAQLRQKLAVLNAKFKQSQKQIKDLQHQHQAEKQQLLENIRLGQKESKFFAALVRKIISNEQIEIVRAASEWNDQTGDYTLVPFLLKDKKITFPKLAQRDIQDLQEQDIQSRELITYDNDPRKRNRWDQVITNSPGKPANRSEKNSSKARNSNRESSQQLNPMREEYVPKVNRNVLLVPLTQDTIEVNGLTDRLGGTGKLELKRNKILDPLVK